jgi:PAS domain S-box-containing protein
MSELILFQILLAIAIVFLILACIRNLALKRRVKVYDSCRRHYENIYKSIFDAAKEAFLIYDPESDTIVKFNQSLCDLFDVSPEESNRLDLRTIYSSGPPYSFEDAQIKHKEALAGNPQIYEWAATDKTGGKLWIEISLSRFLYSDKPHLLFSIRDISHRKKDAERIYRLINIVDQIGEGVAAADLNGLITYTNKAWADMHGYAPEALIGKHLSMFHSEEQNVNEVTPFNKKVIRTGCHSGEIGHKRSDGSCFTTFMTTTLQRDESGNAIGFIGVATDLSEQKRVEEALRESEIKFRYLYNLIPQPILLTDLNGKLIDVNEKFCNFMQCQRSDVIGKNIVDFGFPIEDRQRFTELLTSTGEVTDLEISATLKDGQPVQLVIYSTLIQLKGQFLAISVYHDITTQRKLETQLIQSQKMEAIGTLAGGIAHDFNNILSAILGYIELSKINVDPDSKIFQYLDEMFKASNRAIELVRQILSFSRQTEQKKKPINLETIISDVVRLLKATLPVSIEIAVNISENSGLTMANPGQIQQVLMNLATNAVQSMTGKRGTLTISLDAEHITQIEVLRSLNLNPGHYLKLTVSDTGHGISHENRKRIFDPYYTTKDKGIGTGLGLAVALGIIQKHGGAITFSSEIGKGTDFYVYLPVIEKSFWGENRKKEKGNKLLPVGDERVLLVDDEETILHTGKEMLEYLGYSVTTCNKSVDALAVFKKDPDAFDLVISDMSMPEMNGDRLAAELIDIRPDILILLCTGYNPRIDENLAQKIGVKAFVFKPLTFRQLAVTVRNILDEKETVQTAQRRHDN